MGHFETSLTDDEFADQPVARERNRSYEFSETRDLPMILAVRNATFVSYWQLFEQLKALGTETTRQGFSWRLNRLVDVRVVRKMAQIFPYRGPVYTITRAGLSCLEACGEGLASLTSESRSLPNELQAAHFLELGEIRSALRRRRILKKWISDVELKSLNLVMDAPLAKDYDAVAELTVNVVGEITMGIEFERSVKSAARYREIVDLVKNERQIDLLLLLASSFDLVFQLKAVIRDLEFPICVAQSRAFCKEPLLLQMHNTLDRDKLSLVEIGGMLDERSKPRHS